MENGKDQKFLERIFRTHKANTLIFNRPKKDKATGTILEIKQVEKLMVDFFREDEDDEDNLMECIVTLNNVIRFCDSSDAYKGFYQSYWDSIDLENLRDTTSLLKDLKLLLTEFEKHIKPILFLGGKNDILEDLKEKKGTLSPYLNKIGVLSLNNNTSHLFSSILKFRNEHIHQDTANQEDLEYGQYKIPADAGLTFLQQMILLCSCGLLLIVDKYRAKIDQYLEDHKDEWMVSEEGNDGEAKKFDFDSFIEGYVNSLNDYTKARMAEKVGTVGGLSNEARHLMTLMLKKEVAENDEWEDDEKKNEASESKESEVPMGEIAGVKERVCFILGNPGAGKTTVLQNLILNHCDEYTENQNNAIPILLNLNELRGNEHNIEPHILNAIKDREMFREANQDDILKELKKREVAYYIDGINEAHIEHPDTFMTNLKDFANERSGCRFYLTGRKYEFASYRKTFGSLKDSGIFEVQEISDRQRKEFLKDLGMTAENIEEFERKIEDADIAELLGSPLNFSMAAKVFIRNSSEMSVSNRGELLERFMYDTLSETKNWGSEKEARIYAPRAYTLLQHIARFMLDRKSPFGVMESEIPASPFSAEDTEKILQTVQNLNIIYRKEKFGDHEIRFFVDTYYEYFLARQLMLEFVNKGLDTMISSIDFNDENNFETLKLIIEIISCQKNQKDSIMWGRAFVSGIIKDGQTGDPGILNRHLVLLSTMVANLKPHNQKDNPDARLTVENLILNYLVHYRCTHKCELADDNEYLKTLFSCAVTLSGKEILKEIFSLYWLTGLMVTDPSEVGVGSSGDIRESYPMRNIIVHKGSNICEIYDRLQMTWADLVCIWPKTAQNIRNFLTSLFMVADTASQKKLYAHIMKRGQKDSPDREFLLTDANILLLFINDMDFVAKFNAKDFHYQIFWAPVKALMRLHKDSRLADFVFSDSFIEKMTPHLRKDILLYMVRFHLFRGLTPNALKEFIFGDDPKILKYISESEYRTLLDIIPSHRIPKEVTDRYYNSEIHRFVVNKMRNSKDESFGSLSYTHFHSDKDTITIAISNIRSSFEDKYVLFSIDGKSYEHRIIEDRWQLAQQTTFIISSLDKSIIPAQGRVVTDKGKEHEYLAYTSGHTITLLVHDKTMADDLADAGRLTLEGTECSFLVKPGKFNRYRTLRIEKRTDVAVTETTGEVSFAEKTRDKLLPMKPDKQIREEEERNNRDNFRILPSGKAQNASIRTDITALQYSLIGIHDNAAWITCDPLKADKPFGDRKVQICESTQLGTTYLGNVKHTGRYGHKLVEMTFRCKLKPNLAKYGEISVKYPDRVEKHKYIYSFVSHKTVILRLNEKAFTDRAALDSLIKACRKQEVRFRAASFDLHLESAEILNTESMYSIGIHVNKGENAKVPSNGLIKCEDNSSFEVRKDYRTLSSEISGISTFRIDSEKNKASFFIPDDSVKAYCSHYICIGNSPLHLKIKGSPEKLQWAAQMTLSLEINWPASRGILRFDTIQDKAFCFMHMSDDDIRLWPSEGEITLEEFRNLFDTAENVMIQTDERTFGSSIQGHSEPVADSSLAYILNTDFPSSDKADILAWSAPEKDRVMLCCRIPVNNRKEKIRVIEFKQSTARYRKNEQDIMIVKPSTQLPDMWVKVDDGKMFRIVSVTQSAKDSNYVILKLRDQENLAPNLNHSGQIRFFTRDRNQYKPAKIGYQNIFNLVNWNKPDLYHADICKILEDELIESGVEINDTVSEFFESKSMAYSLISNPVLFNKVKAYRQREKITTMKFDVCKVVSTANDTQLSAVSYMQKGLVTTSDTDPEIAGHAFCQGDYILYERNHKIHYLEAPPHDASMGFFHGTAIRRMKDGNHFIRVTENNEDFYCTADIELGDKVIFFASYNTLYTKKETGRKKTNRNLAEDVDTVNIQKSVQHDAVIKSIVKVTENGIDLIKMTVISGESREEFTFRADSYEWSLMSSRKEGDICKCFFCRNKMFLNY